MYTMFGRIIILRKCIDNCRQIKRYAKFNPRYREPHMNELPVPCGPWKEMYDRKQQYYNKTLMGGMAWFVISLAALIRSNAMFMNWSPPRYPADVNKNGFDDIEEC